MELSSGVEPVVLEGRYVRLEPLELSHAEPLFAASRDAAIWTYLLVPQPDSVEAMASWIGDGLEHQSRGTQLPFAQRRLADGKVIGSTRYLDIRPFERAVEIGWTWLEPSAQRTPVNTEAKLLLLRHAFDALGCRRVQLKTDAKNERSRRAIERLGTPFEGVLRNNQRYWHGGWRDTAIYAFADSDWPEAKSKLERVSLRYTDD